MAVHMAVKLDLVDALSAADGHTLTADELAVKVVKAEDKAESAALISCILRFLMSFDVVSCSTKKGPGSAVLWRYSLAPRCWWFTMNNGEGSLGPVAVFDVDEPTALGGTPAYNYFRKNPRLSTLFDQAMAHQSLLVIRKLLEHPKVFDSIEVIVDVGGGTGATLALIRGRYKHIKGINMDLAHVISEAPSLKELFYGTQY
uniref:O-methyltransferase domain-containing protein n=1 Tax=Setaria italica TaxID=4555 RepID=K3ZMM5_SETIT